MEKTEVPKRHSLCQDPVAGLGAYRKGEEGMGGPSLHTYLLYTVHEFSEPSKTLLWVDTVIPPAVQVGKLNR